MISMHMCRRRDNARNPENKTPITALPCSSTYTGLNLGALRSASMAPQDPGGVVSNCVNRIPHAFQKRITVSWMPYLFFLGLITSNIIIAAMINSSRKIIFRLVVFFWYPSAVLSSFSASFTSVAMRSTL